MERHWPVINITPIDNESCQVSSDDTINIEFTTILTNNDTQNRTHLKDTRTSSLFTAEKEYVAVPQQIFANHHTDNKESNHDDLGSSSVGVLEYINIDIENDEESKSSHPYGRLSDGKLESPDYTDIFNDGNSVSAPHMTGDDLSDVIVVSKNKISEPSHPLVRLPDAQLEIFDHSDSASDVQHFHDGNTPDIVGMDVNEESPVDYGILTLQEIQKSQYPIDNGQDEGIGLTVEPRKYASLGNKATANRCPCLVCGKRFLSPTALRLHSVMTHSGSRQYSPSRRCQFCNKGFTSTWSFELHMCDHLLPDVLLPRTYACVKCHKVFKNEDDLKTHQANHQLLFYACSKCGSHDFESATKLKVHVRFCKQQHICAYCQSNFNDETELVVHRIRHLTDISKQALFVCPICDFCTVVQWAFRLHLQRHSVDIASYCWTCNLIFDCTEALHSHRKTHNLTRFRCELCNIAFSVQSVYMSHVKKHQFDTRFKCHFKDCGACFQSLSAIVKHAGIHMRTGEDGEPCSECSKTFRHKSNYKLHMLKHQGFFYKTCTFCNIAFVTRHDFHEHKCPFGTKKVSTKRIRGFGGHNYTCIADSNVKVITKQECVTNRCTKCEQFFSTPRALQQHIRSNACCPGSLNVSIGDIATTKNAAEYASSTEYHFPCPKCSDTFRSAIELYEHSVKDCQTSTKRKRFVKKACRPLPQAEGLGKAAVSAHSKKKIQARRKKLKATAKCVPNRRATCSDEFKDHSNSLKICTVCEMTYKFIHSCPGGNDQHFLPYGPSVTFVDTIPEGV